MLEILKFDLVRLSKDELSSNASDYYSRQREDLFECQVEITL